MRIIIAGVRGTQPSVISRKLELLCNYKVTLTEHFIQQAAKTVSGGTNNLKTNLFQQPLLVIGYKQVMKAVVKSGVDIFDKLETLLVPVD